MVKEIKLHHGNIAFVDDEDYERVNQYKWYCDRHGYAMRKENIIRKTILMHRFILGAPFGLEVDHADGNKLNNSKSNLRLCTKSDNQHNKKKQSVPATSKYKGVCWDSSKSKWRVDIKIHGKHINVGRFVNEIDAAHAYDAKAIELHGEFANTNFK